MIGRIVTQINKNMQKLPILDKMLGITPTSPLELFNREQLYKLSQEATNPGYWKGSSVHIAADGTHSFTAPDAALGKFRQITAGVVGGGLLANAMGIDPFGSTSMLKDAMWGLGHLGVGTALFQLGGRARMLGTAYLGVGAYNATQPGDQWGPF